MTRRQGNRWSPVGNEAGTETSDDTGADPLGQRCLDIRERGEGFLDVMSSRAGEAHQLGGAVRGVLGLLHQAQLLELSDHLVHRLPRDVQSPCQLDGAGPTAVEMGEEHRLRPAHRGTVTSCQGEPQALVEPAETSEKDAGEVRLGHRVKLLDALGPSPVVSRHLTPRGDDVTLTTTVVAETIDVPPDVVAQDLADPTTHPEWATEFFAGPVEPTSDGDFAATVPMMGGLVRLRVEAHPALGVVDLYLAPEGAPFGPPLPIRVVPNGDGADVLFTLARFPGTSDEAWARGIDSMRRELSRLRRRLEAR